MVGSTVGIGVSQKPALMGPSDPTTSPRKKHGRPPSMNKTSRKLKRSTPHAKVLPSQDQPAAQRCGPSMSAESDDSSY